MEEFPEPQRSLVAQATVAVSLIFALLAPGIELAINGQDVESVRREQRNPAPFPPVSLDPATLVGFPAGFDRWFQDAFGLRDVLIRAHNHFSVFALGLSPIDTLLIGKEGWIFHLEKQAMESFRGEAPFESWELDQWQRCLELRREFVESQGGVYLAAFVPSKLEVYDELIPDHFARLGPNRTAQLHEHLRQHSDLRLVELLPALRAEKDFDRPDRHVYYPHGVHWTGAGAAAAYRELLGALQSTPFGAPPLGRDAFEANSMKVHRDSWAPRLHLEGKIVDQEVGIDRVGGWKARLEKRIRPAFMQDRRYVQDDASLPTAAIFHDSMGPWLMPFLAEHFSRLEGLRRLYFSPLALQELRPDVVFDVFGDRQLASRWPIAPTLAIQDRLKTSFDASKDVRLLADVTQDLRADPRWKGAKVSTKAGALEVAVQSNLHALVIPPFDASMSTDPNEFLVLKIDLTGIVDSQLDVMYKFSADDSVDPLRSYAIEGQAGRHVLYIPLSHPRMLGEEVLLRVGQNRGRYVLRHLEIRAVSDL